MTTNISTPGVYINELNAFPNSVVPVATAVPAFIGYTPRAEYEGKSYYNTPVKITSFADFQAFFLPVDPPPPADRTQQYQPQYYLVEQDGKPTTGNYLFLNEQYYSALPDPGTIYYLYNSVRLFYQNGGGDAYIVAVGDIGPATGKPLAVPGARIINPNVQLHDLIGGLEQLKNQQEPTLYLCPEAVLLSVEDNAMLMQAMLRQASEMRTALCLFDIIGGDKPDPVLYTRDIKNFRDSVGNVGLEYGASYYPFIDTSLMQENDIDFRNLFGGNVRQLAALLSPPSMPNPAAEKVLEMIETPPANPLTNSQLHSALLNASSTYAQIIRCVLAEANRLPPGGAMAGIYANNDSTRGVWSAPANTGIVGAIGLSIRLDDSQQANLNIDAESGKSINVIRFFAGQGILVWGARTLDGNSQDWRYIAVRRTVTFLEQSIKLAMRAYVFAPNDANTWVSIKAMIESFLTQVWKEGGLMGASPADAFQVSVGLGSTMTGDDVLNGIVRVTAKVSLIHPAEYIVITFEQEQAAP